jgi:DNA-binding NtrC family response regulator
MILHRQPSPPQDSVSNGKVLLCVDDSKLALLVCAQLLSRHGYGVIATDNAEQALDAIDRHIIDAVITDYEMPGMNGGELAAHVKSSAHPLPVLLYTGCADLPASAKACVDAILAKGRPVRDFLATVDSSLALSSRTLNSRILELTAKAPV